MSQSPTYSTDPASLGYSTVPSGGGVNGPNKRERKEEMKISQKGIIIYNYDCDNDNKFVGRAHCLQFTPYEVTYDKPKKARRQNYNKEGYIAGGRGGGCAVHRFWGDGIKETEEEK